MPPPDNEPSIYDAVETLQSALKSAFLHTWADRLEGSLRGGATSSEILGNLTGDLEAMIGTGVASEAGLLSDACEILSHINRAFERVGQPSRDLSKACLHVTFGHAD